MNKILITTIAFVLAGLNSAGATTKNEMLQISTLNQAIKASGATWTAKETPLSHMTKAEAQRMMGLDRSLGADVSFSGPKTHLLTGLPSAVDWRNKDGKNWVSPILNQANCGSCVAFASIGVLETQVKIASKFPDFNVQLSPQNLFSCGGGMCEYGWAPGAAAQFLQDTGVTDEACQPYMSGATGEDVACSAACADAPKRVIKIAGYASPTLAMTDTDAVKAALQNGPVVTTLTVYADFMSYSSGVYKHVAGDALGGHAVSIVGYDDATQSYIIRNSWGLDWGENGFAHVAYSDISGIGDETWSFNVPSGGAVSLQSPRDYSYFSGTLPMKAFSTFTSTDSLTLTIFDANKKPVFSGACATQCDQNVDLASFADGRYEAEVTAMDSKGMSLGASAHQFFYVANQKPTLGVSFTGKSVDLTKPVTDRIEFNIVSTTSSVPMSGMEFHYKDAKGVETVRHASIAPAQMTMGWRTNLVPNGQYEIWFVGHVVTNTFDVPAESAHMTVQTQN